MKIYNNNRQKSVFILLNSFKIILKYINNEKTRLIYNII